MSNVSIWGVDHGVELSKAHRKLTGGEKVAVGAVSTLQTPLPGTGGALAGALMSKKGRKLPNAARAGGRSFAEALGGATAGAVLSRGRSVGLTSVGALAGGAHGGIAAMNNAGRRGDLK